MQSAFVSLFRIDVGPVNGSKTRKNISCGRRGGKPIELRRRRGENSENEDKETDILFVYRC